MGHLGVMLGHCGAMSLCGHLGAMLGHLGAVWGHLGAILGPLYINCVFFLGNVPARTQECQGTKWRFTPGGQALWLYCLECQQKRWPQEAGALIVFP